MVQDMPRHIIEIPENVRSFDPQDLNTLRLQPRIPPLIIRHLFHGIMKAAVNLDGQSHRGAVKIQHIRSGRMLPPELQALRPPAQPLP
jgi:hypothetical protein